MTGLRDLLKKKDKIDKGGHDGPSRQQVTELAVPEFTFKRVTTTEEVIIQPPSFPGDDDDETGGEGTRPKSGVGKKESKRLHLGFRKSSHAGSTRDISLIAPEPPEKSSQQLPVRPKNERKLSERLHLHRSRSATVESSTNLPDDLPEAPTAVVALPASTEDGVVDEAKAEKERREAQWEKRATILAHGNPLLEGQQKRQEETRSQGEDDDLSEQNEDDNIQEAIRLHESGDLEHSTVMFGRLSDPRGANNALAQVLYGLALRHGWGIPPEPEKAINYLSLAAANSASIEEQALASGMKKGGAAKGELVLAIFELANCFRHGWGVKKDALAARQYYETAANLGDTDAMEEAAWCYIEGFGGAKDKFKAASYLRFAEEKGSKAVGNSWIWKDKYNPK
ncbi:hypothetical protein LTR08_003805 [Meristemomyces frigidus]|nr:hypothetical protein LTR08_003805 [Meristemomyces frigidus]